LRVSHLGIERIEDLEIFVRIVERGSLTSAGVSLGMTTAVISRRLSALEQGLGARLIDRNSRMLVLTERGREFHRRAEAILRMVTEASREIRSSTHDVRGTLRVSMPTSATDSHFLAYFVRAFHDHPELNIELHLSDRPVDVVAQGLDAAFYVTDAPDRHPEDAILGLHPTCLAASPAYLDRVGRPANPEDLGEHRTIRAVSSRGRGAVWVLTHADGRKILVPPSERMFLTDDLRLSFSAVVEGAGIGRMPLGYVAQGMGAGMLELVLPQWRFRPIMLAANVRRSGKHSAKVQLMLKIVSDLLEHIDALAADTPLDEYFKTQKALDARGGLASPGEAGLP
jgi:DNA-binding transcriptional LysR family regulator